MVRKKMTIQEQITKIKEYLQILTLRVDHIELMQQQNPQKKKKKQQKIQQQQQGNDPTNSL